VWTAIHSTILDSSLRREEASTRWLWLTMLLLGDESGDGTVDMPISALAARAALSEEETVAGLSRLSESDPDSRSKLHGGRRLMPLHEDSPQRGWIVVNWPEYRQRANAEARREQLANNSKAYRDRLKEMANRGITQRGRKRNQSSSTVIKPSLAVIPSPSPSPSESKSQGEEKRAVHPAAFKAPTVDDVRAFCQKKGGTYLKIDANRFVAKHLAVGWVDRAGLPIKNWQAVLFTWVQREEGK
jgi:hypothetical protein